MSACGSLTVDPTATMQGCCKPGHGSSQGDIWAETASSSSFGHKVHANVPTSLQRAGCAGFWHHRVLAPHRRVLAHRVLAHTHRVLAPHHRVLAHRVLAPHHRVLALQGPGTTPQGSGTTGSWHLTTGSWPTGSWHHFTGFWHHRVLAHTHRVLAPHHRVLAHRVLAHTHRVLLH
ncbi:hypothetical protein V8C86DRAFT_2437527 [Haematococcus lacustris]